MNRTTINIGRVENFNGEPKGETVILEGWVARDKNGLVFIHSHDPIRRKTVWLAKESESYDYLLPQGSFPSLTWEDEPKKVKIIVTMEE